MLRLALHQCDTSAGTSSDRDVQQATRLNRRSYLFKRNGSAEEEALSHRGAGVGDEPEILHRFDAFRDCLEAELVRQAQRDSNDTLLFLVDSDVGDQGTIQLHAIEWQAG